ncbi:hypothetical protein BC829DRAFT_413607 [Chytridium lagenaria]|nr:hypothetical protein BC829DRAFT_413607 [Chytridium lagenaria]
MNAHNRAQLLQRVAAEDQGIQLMFSMAELQLPPNELQRVPFSSSANNKKTIAYMMTSLHIGKLFFVDEYLEHGKPRSTNLDANAKKALWFLNTFTRENPVVSLRKMYVRFNGDSKTNFVELPFYINLTNRGASLKTHELEELHDLEDLLLVGFKSEHGERWDTKEECVKYLADAIIRFKNRNNKHHVGLQQKSGANERIRRQPDLVATQIHVNSVQRQNMTEITEAKDVTPTTSSCTKEASNQTLLRIFRDIKCSIGSQQVSQLDGIVTISYCSCKDHDGSIQENPLTTSTTTTSNEDPIGASKSTIQAEHEAQLGMVNQLEPNDDDYDVDIEMVSLDLQSKDRDLGKHTIPVKGKEKDLVDSVAGSQNVIKDGKIVYKDDAFAVAHRLIDNVGSVLFDGEIPSFVDIADILFVNNDTGEMQYDTNGEVPFQKDALLKVFIILRKSRKGQCGTDISKHKPDKSHGKMKELDSGSRRLSQVEIARQAVKAGNPRANGIDLTKRFYHSAPSSPPADNIQDEATSASDQSTANASSSDEESSSKEFFKASRKRQLKDSSQYNHKKVNRRKDARKLSGRSSSKNVTKQTIHQMMKLGKAFWRLTDDTGILSPRENRMSDDKAAQTLHKADSSRPQTVDTYKYCKGIVVLDYFFKNDPVISKVYVPLRKKSEDFRRQVGGFSKLVEHFRPRSIPLSYLMA